VFCRTGLLRGGRSLRASYTGRGGCEDSGPCHWSGGELVVAAEAVDEAAVALRWALGGCGVSDGAEEFAFFGGSTASLFTFVGFAVEGLSDGCGATLLADGENFDVELTAFVFDVEHVADTHLAGGFCGEIV
jgi:hypothetical protein